MPRYTTLINATGQDGNTLFVLANASRMMRELGHDQDEIKALAKHVFGSKSCREAIDHIREWFPVYTGEGEGRT